MRDTDVWRAFDPDDVTIVLIDLEASPAAALELASGMPAVWTQVVGSYVVTGPAKSPAGTSTQGESNVEAVADCLRG